MLPLCAIFLVSFEFISSLAVTQGFQSFKLEKDYLENSVYRDENISEENHKSNKITLIKRQFQYYAKVKFGSNSQPYKVIFDTGSGITWIPKEYSKENTCAIKNKPFISSSFKDFNILMNLTYGKGTATVNLGSDSVTIGNMTVKNQTFGLANNSDCVTDTYEGIIGMSFQSIDNHSSIMQNMLSQGLIKEPVFAFHLDKNQESTDSELTIGGYNPKYILNDQQNKLQVDNAEHWQVPMESVMFGKHIIAIDQKAIIDSGTSIIVAPFKFLQSIRNIIMKSNDVNIRQENGSLSFTRSKSFKLPNISFVLGNNLYTLTYEDYTDQDSSTIDIFFDNSFADTWVLGHSFLQKYYTVFDFNKRTISLPKTRFISRILLKSILKFQDQTSKGNSTGIIRIEDMTYLLIYLLLIHKFNSILRS